MKMCQKCRLTKTLKMVLLTQWYLLSHLIIADRAATEQSVESHSLCEGEQGNCSNNKRIKDEFPGILSNSSYLTKYLCLINRFKAGSFRTKGSF